MKQLWMPKAGAVEGTRPNPWNPNVEYIVPMDQPVTPLPTDPKERRKRERGQRAVVRDLLTVRAPRHIQNEVDLIRTSVTHAPPALVDEADGTAQLDSKAIHHAIVPTSGDGVFSLSKQAFLSTGAPPAVADSALKPDPEVPTLTLVRPMSAQPRLVRVSPQEGGDESPAVEPSWGPMPVKVAVVASDQQERPLATIDFRKEAALSDSFSGGKDRLTLFRHVEGSKVLNDIMPTYHLPNGKQVHFFYSGSNPTPVLLPLLAPPAPPSSLSDFGRSALPHISKKMTMLKMPEPKACAGTLARYKPVPQLCPAPYTPWSLDDEYRDGTADLISPALNIVITCENIYSIKTVLEKQRPPPPKHVWKIASSIFGERARESDSKGFFDDDKVIASGFAIDYERMLSKQKFRTVIEREAKSTNDIMAPDKQVAEFKQVFLKAYPGIITTFNYYAALSIKGISGVQRSEYTSFTEDCKIPDAESASCKRADLDTLFILTNFVQNKKNAANEGNFDTALNRPEWMEIIVRIAIAKYGNGVLDSDMRRSTVGSCLRTLIEENLLPNLPPDAMTSSDTFRRERMYFEGVDSCLSSHRVMVNAIFAAFRVRLPSGQRPRELQLTQWHVLCDQIGLIASEFTRFTLRESTMIFAASRMYKKDEAGNQGRMEGLSRVEFYEVLCRTAEHFALPSAADCRAAGFLSKNPVAAFFRELADSGAEAAVSAGGGETRLTYPPPVTAPKRPLEEYVAAFLEVVFSGLFVEICKSPAETYKPELLLRELKKINNGM